MELSGTKEIIELDEKEVRSGKVNLGNVCRL